MKYRILFLCGTLLSCIQLYSSAPRLANLEEITLDNPQINHPDSHATFAANIQKAGLDVPEDDIIKHLDYCIKYEHPQYEALKKCVAPTRKRNDNKKLSSATQTDQVDLQPAAASSSTSNENLEVAGDPKHILAFATSLYNASREGDKVRAKKACRGLTASCALAAVGAGTTALFAYLNSQK